MAADILISTRRAGVAWLTLNRPEKRNALARELVAAIRDTLDNAVSDPDIRAIVLAGAGPVFCAGADLNQYVLADDRPEVVADAARLYDLLEFMAVCAKPIIARVHKAAFGGAIGLVAAADLVVATPDTRFSLSEARLGLVPAAIGPALVRAVGPHHAKAAMLRAEPFSADEALRIGLIHTIASDADIDTVVQKWLSEFHQNAPGALRDIKQLVDDIAFGTFSAAAMRERCTSLAADRRADPEGQEGMRSFLEKRRPTWAQEQA